MENQSSKNINKGKKLIILGFSTIAILFLIYSRYQNPEVLTPDAIDSILRIAYGFYITLVASFGVIAIGMYRYHKGKVEGSGKDLSTIIALTTWNLKSRKIFVATFIAYGIFFSLVSGTLVYQPEVSFSYHYGAEIPSGFIAPCCGEPGYMPKIIVYLTDHIGLQIIPVNLVLQVIVSYLVGLNTSIAIKCIYNFKERKRVKFDWCSNRSIHCMSNLCSNIYVNIYWNCKWNSIINCINTNANTIHCNIYSSVTCNPIHNGKKITKCGW